MKLNRCLIAAAVFALSVPAVQAGEKDLSEMAREIAHKGLIADTHIDVPYRLEHKWEDVSGHTHGGDFDYQRARDGGLDVPFMSIYTPAEAEEAGTSYQLANKLIDGVEALVGRAPDKFTIVVTADEAEQAFKAGKMGLAMGMENGSPIDGKLENVGFFRERGISYIGLTHSLSNHLADSSYDEERKWNGLSDFGKEVIMEMNRQGIMVDVSHLSDEAFWDVLAVSKVPVIASHSSCRHFTPGFERNMSDEMIKAMAEKGGVIQINFGSSFVTEEAMKWFDQMDVARSAWLEEHGYSEDSKERSLFKEIYLEDNPFPFANMDDLVRHYNHVVELVGIEHVGIGSDFDGVGDSLPEGMKDVSFYPNLVEHLLRQEYSVEDIQGVMGDNLLRVWRATEEYSKKAVPGP